MVEIRKEIMDFALAMEKKIQKHDGDRGDEWKEESVSWLIGRLGDEVDELCTAYFEGESDSDICLEAVDVGAFAMFVYHRMMGRQKEGVR